MRKGLYLLGLLSVLGLIKLTPLATAEAEKFIIPSEPIVVMETSQGNIELKLFPSIAPKACENFLTHAKKGYYDNTIFHRVIKDFMIQGGDPLGTGRGGQSIWGGIFDNEVTPDVTFDRAGILAMANRGPDTNGSQFFITTAPAHHLDQNYTIFGEVISGMDVVHKIENVSRDGNDRPLEDQKLNKVYQK